MRQFRRIGFVLILGMLAAAASGENIVFPSDAGVVDVTEGPYHARGDGVHDDTAAIQQALDAYPNGNRIIYLPNGTYLVSDRLDWPAGRHGGEAHKRTILQGQSRDGTVIRLKDECPGYGDPENRKAVIWTGPKPAQRFRNAIRNLTVDIGSGNPGACGIQFNCSNQGCVRDVRIVSTDGQGVYGLDLAFTNEIGPLLIRGLEVVGFDVGIKTASNINSMTLEHVRLKGQNRLGIDNGGQVFSLRGLESVNVVPAVRNDGCMTLIDAHCLGGSGDLAAIVNEDTLYARNVQAAGYGRAIANRNGQRDAPGGRRVGEFVSAEALRLFPSPAASLNLPIEDTPEVPWDDLSQWANPEDYGADKTDGDDDTAAFQAAIDSGKTTVYIPAGGTFHIEGTLRVRGDVRRIIGTEGRLKGNGTIVFEDGTHPAVVFERFNVSYAKLKIRHEASRTLVLSSAIIASPTVCTGSGDLFVDDVCGGEWRFENPDQRIWARQLNIESGSETNVVNEGATLWVLGLKTEQERCKIETTAGGRTELLGAHVYAQSDKKVEPLLRIIDGSASFACVRQISYNNAWYDTVVEETRDGVTRTLTRQDAGNTLELYAGFEPAVARR